VTVLGDRLRQAREAREISVQAVSSVTKIREHILIALETDTFEDLPAPVFVRGFLRTLARYYKLNTEELLALYAEAVPQEPSLESAPAVEDRPAPAQAPVISGRRTWPGWLNPSSVMFGLIAVLVVAALVWGGNGLMSGGIKLPDIASFLPQPSINTPVPAARATTSATPVAASAAPTAAVVPTTVASATTAPAATVPAIFATPTMTTPPAAAFEVRLDIVSRAWVKVEVDGVGAHEGVLDTGTSKTFKAAKRLTLRVGNAAGVTVALNGKAQPALGADGDVVDRMWVLDDTGAIATATPVWTNPPSTPTPTAVAPTGTAPAPTAAATPAPSPTR